jgi:hypothetical protein
MVAKKEGEEGGQADRELVVRGDKLPVHDVWERTMQQRALKWEHEYV